MVAQRLVRTICPNCLETYRPGKNLLAQAGIADGAAQTFNRGAGCCHCYDSGFAGRQGIYEVMEMTPDLRRMVRRDISTQQLRSAWLERGGSTLRQEGVLTALDGLTSLEEALSVTYSEQEEMAATDDRTMARAATAS